MTRFAGAIPLIRARFEAARAASAADGQEWATWPFAYTNGEAAFQQQQDGPWLYLEVLSMGSWSSVFGRPGKRFAQDDGLIAAHVFVRTGDDVLRAYQGAAAIGEIFRVVSFEGVTCQAPATGDGGSGDDAGRWFRVSVSVPFSTHYTA